MIHQPLGGARGQVTDIEIQAREAIFLKKRLIEILIEKTGQSYEVICASVERDRYMSAQEAIDFHLVDDFLFTKKHISV